MRAPFFCLCLVAAACQSGKLSHADHELTVPAAVAFGDGFLGHPRAAPLTLVNPGRASVKATLVVDPPFSVPAEVEVVGGQALEVPITFTATALGPATGTLTVRFGEQSREVALSAQGVAVPECAAADECRTSTFDPDAGGCVEAALPDDAPCAAGDACLTGARCLAGSCRGQAVECDDANACTRDSCSSATGCRHDDLSRECPRSADPCEVATCVPSSGCRFVTAADGAACGPNTCLTAEVCIAGACLTRAAPEGSACAPPTPCEGEAVCRQQQCVRPAATPVQPLWRYTPAPGATLGFDGTVDPDGNVYFVESGAQLWLVSLDREGRPRYRVQLAAVCPSYCGATLMLDPPANRIYLARGTLGEARGLDTGALLWSTDLAVGVPAIFPKPDGGGSFGAYAPISLGAGKVGFMLGEGYQLHNQYLVALERTTGAFAWRVHRPGHVAGEGASALGSVYLTSAGCWAPEGEMVRIDPGGVIGRAQVSFGAPLAVAGERSVWSKYTSTVQATVLLDQNFAEAVLSLPAGHTRAYSNVVMDDRRAVIPSTHGASGTTWLTDFDSTTLLPRWSVKLPTGSGYPEAMLAGSGDLLVTTSEPDGGGKLIDVGADGGIGFACPFEEAPRSPPAVVKGRLVVSTWSGRSQLVSYELPGLDTATSGWAGASGGPWRDRRAH